MIRRAVARASPAHEERSTGSEQPIQRPEDGGNQADRHQLRVGRPDVTIHHQVRRPGEHGSRQQARQATKGAEPEIGETGAGGPHRDNRQLDRDRQPRHDDVNQLDKIVETHLVVIEERLPFAVAEPFDPANRQSPLGALRDRRGRRRSDVRRRHARTESSAVETASTVGRKSQPTRRRRHRPC